MKRWMSAVVVTASMGCTQGCGEPATLDVFVEARDGTQWALCQASLDTAKASTCATLQAKLFSDGCSAPTTAACDAIVPGETFLRVGVLYTDAELEEPGRRLPAPDIHFVLGSTSVPSGGQIQTSGAKECNGNDDCPRAWSEFQVPFSTDTDTVLEVLAGDQAEHFELVLAPPTLAISTVPDAPTLPAGVGSIVVEVQAPRLLEPKTTRITSVFDDIEQTSPALTMDLVPTADGERLRGSMSVPVPDRPGTRWKLRATSGALVTTTEVGYALVAPSETKIVVLDYDPRSDLASLDFDAPPAPPKRILGEPDPACRELWVAVETEHPPIESELTLSTTAGTLGPTTVSLDGGRGATRLTLPEASASQEIMITATGTGLPTSTQRYRFEPTLPTRVVLFSGPPFVSVGTNGSASASVSGQAYFPDGVRPTTADVSLVVTATDGPNPPPCAPAIPASRLFCDADDALDDGGIVGDCLLTPPTITPGSTGAFSIPLSGGMCFTGTVVLSVYAEVAVEQEDACIGEWPVDRGPGTDPLDSFEIAYMQP